MSERKQWPSFPKHPRETYPPQFNALSDQWKAALLDYERNRADAWEARARLAVEALKKLHPLYPKCWDLTDGSIFMDKSHVAEFEDAHEALDEALALIGELPDKR